MQTRDPTDHSQRAHSSRDGDAWLAEVLAAHEARLVRYARSLTGDADRARDIVQDTFLRLCEQDRDRIEPYLTRWLFTVCRNRAMDVIRKESRMSTVDGTAVAPSVASTRPGPAEVAEVRDAARNVLTHVDRLPPAQREVVRLKFQAGLKYREIADVTGTTVGNVGFLLHHAMKTLRARLTDLPVSATAAQGDAR